MKGLIYAMMLFAFTKSYAQGNESPKVGQPMPDFQLNDVQFYSQKSISLSDFKGKWLILDFWNEYCSTCLSSFPKIDSLQKKFADRVKFVLVGYNGSQYFKKSSNTSIRKLFEQNRKRENLKLTIAYDSTLMHRYNIRPTPYLIIVDPKGIVRGITTKLSSENIDDLIAGRQVNLKRAYLGGERLMEKRKKE